MTSTAECYRSAPQLGQLGQLGQRVLRFKGSTTSEISKPNKVTWSVFSLSRWYTENLNVSMVRKCLTVDANSNGHRPRALKWPLIEFWKLAPFNNERKITLYWAKLYLLPVISHQIRWDIIENMCNLTTSITSKPYWIIFAVRYCSIAFGRD